MISIPIVINNRDRFSSLQNMIIKLNNLGYDNIYILDNESTYPPLLEYYKSCQARVVHLGDNMGHQALWKSGALNMFKKHKWIVYTDSDIELNKDTPSDFIESLVELAEQYNTEKAGLAIEYLDIPRSLANDRSRRIEERYWKKRLEHPYREVYSAYIDTTFAVVKTSSVYSWAHPAVRVAGSFLCRHLPWYQPHYEMMDAEYKYYIDHADSKFCTYKKLMQ